MKKIIYLDNGATTPVYPEVIKEMNKFYSEKYGNPSSPHELGEAALKEMNSARRKIAQEILAKVFEIIFTSGGTEANNLAILGLANANPGKKKIIISAIEHSSVYESCMALKEKGYKIIEIPVDNNGLADIGYLERAIDNKTLLVSIIHANNEIGVLQDLSIIGKICKRKGVIFHTDAVQSFGKEKINVRDFAIDMLSASAHKISGPKGIGFLYIREGIKISPLIIGGGQEHGIRGGTENVPAIAGFAKALEITKKIDKNKIKKLRDYFADELEKIGGKINGSKEKRLYNNINVSFNGINGDDLVLFLSEKGIMCSTKSACLSKQKKENRVLKALGLKKDELNGAVRFSLNEKTKRKDLDKVLNEISSFLSHSKLY